MKKGVGFVVLAAGASRRMGRPKQLLPVGGMPMIRHVVQAVLAADSGCVLVVCGAELDSIRKELAALPVELVHNPNAQGGMSTSIRAGIHRLSEWGAQAAVVVLGDLPGLQAEVCRRVVEEYLRSKAPIVQARYSDGPGHPVLFDRSLFPELLALTGDKGAKEVLRRHAASVRWVPVEGDMPPDIDTPDDYARYYSNVSEAERTHVNPRNDSK